MAAVVAGIAGDDAIEIIGVLLSLMQRLTAAGGTAAEIIVFGRLAVKRFRDGVWERAKPGSNI